MRRLQDLTLRGSKARRPVSKKRNVVQMSPLSEEGTGKERRFSPSPVGRGSGWGFSARVFFYFHCAATPRGR